MIWFILYLLLIIPAWFVAAKIYLMKGWEKTNQKDCWAFWYNKKGKAVTDVPPSLYGFIWPVMVPFFVAYVLIGLIQKGYKWLDAKIMKTATSVVIKVEKKK
jgi:hypothetical protein